MWVDVTMNNLVNTITLHQIISMIIQCWRTAIRIVLLKFANPNHTCHLPFLLLIINLIPQKYYM